MERYLCDTCLYANNCQFIAKHKEGATGCSAYINTYGVSVDRIGEICEAERDGRLVLIPCKVGEYWARDGKRYIVAEITMTNAGGVMVRHYEEGDGKMLSCNPQYFAQHYTRAEAEEAIEAEIDGTEWET